MLVALLVGLTVYELRASRRIVLESMESGTRSLAEARETLERIGLRLGAIGQDSASLAAPGTVLAQKPRAGRVVERATRIAVTVAIAPALDEPGDTVS